MTRAQKKISSIPPESALREFFGEGRPLGVTSSYLYGSAASGSAHGDSDIDVAVLLDRDRLPSRTQRADLRVLLTSNLIHILANNDVDLIVLNDVPAGLGRHVVTTGIPVYVADAEADHTFRRDVQLRAADLDPFLERMRRIKLEALQS